MPLCGRVAGFFSVFFSVFFRFFFGFFSATICSSFDTIYSFTFERVRKRHPQMLPNVAPIVRSPKQRERALTTLILIAVDSFVGNLKRGKWHYLVVHVRPAFGLTRKVDLYVNCERVASMQSPFSYQNAHGGPYQMNIGQRGLRNLAVARWKVIVITCFCISFKFKHIDSSLMKHISVKHT